MKGNRTYLFSIDLEDVRADVEQGHTYRDAVEKNTLDYLNWLQKHQAKTTFFTVGDIALKYSDLLKEIKKQGHEIACHSMHHTPITKHNKESFYVDISENLEAINKACGEVAEGFRAPVFSLVKETQWAYEVLSKLGFTYSSSVLPAENPLFGWPEFGPEVKRVDGVLELPMSLSSFGPKRIPYAGGVYFRMLPKFIIQKTFAKKDVSLGYFHPYDIDVEQEKFMHAGINNSKFFNFLMYYNRGSVFKKLDAILNSGYEILPYKTYIKSLNV